MVDKIEKLAEDFNVPSLKKIFKYVNVDDEANILKMNKRILSKIDNIELICLRDRSEFVSFLKDCYSNRESDPFDHIVVLMDHMLDRDFG